MQRLFTVSKQAEITVECNPDSVDWRSMARLRRAGVNRISLGVQSADAQQLRCIHRIHTPKQVAQAVADIRQAKLDNLSLDLIYGLPGQTMASWEETLQKTIALKPDHISCYGLKVEEGTPMARQVALGLELPDGDFQADLYLRAVELLQQGGYRQYEISNFSKPGKESRHNLKYWMGREYVGFGPGAHPISAASAMLIPGIWRVISRLRPEELPPWRISSSLPLRNRRGNIFSCGCAPCGALRSGNTAENLA